MEFSRNFYYQAFKHTVYLLLSINVGVFLIEALQGAAVTHTGGVGLSDIIVVYADPIDTAAWLILLLTLELETYILDDDALDGPLYWLLNTINAICYIIIIYSFFGYLGMLGVTEGFATAQAADACSLVQSGASYVITLDEYAPLTAAECGAFPQDYWYNAELNLAATPESFQLLNRLVWLDIVNSAVWLIVVTVLQLEVYLKSSKLLGTTFFTVYKIGKIGLYGILVVACVLWVIWGGFVDAWDAFLWLLAFFFIEMNVLDWQKELAEERAMRGADVALEPTA